MAKYEGCIEAKEISLTRKGANQFAAVLIRKSATAAAAPANPTETSEMSQAEIHKAALAMTVAIAKMSDVTKGYFLALGEDAQTVFLTKSAEDQAKEAEVAKADAERKVAEEEARKSGVTVEVLELRKSNETMAARLAELEKRDGDREIEKRAEREFAGFPGGTAAAVDLLKSYASLPEGARKASEEMMKAQCKTVDALTRSFGARTEADISKADAARARLVEASKAYAEANKVPLDDAKIAVMEKREHAADVEALGGQAF